MHKLETRLFGVIDCPEEAVFEFPRGLPGFEDERRFLFVEEPKTRPLIFMQSLSTADLCFITVPVRVVKPNYQLCLQPEDLVELELVPDRQPEIGRDALCLAIISLEENQPPTANLLSPVVVNLDNRRGLQAIQADSEYSHRHPFSPQDGAAPC
jgi:flagellar assembly factor FliW